MTIEERITKAKVQLLVFQPWFGQLACYIKPIPDKEIPIAGINIKGELYYNPEKLDKLTDEQITGLLCHEIEHLAYQHPWRIETRNPEVFNIAADLKVNTDIEHADMELPPGGLIPRYGEFRIGDILIKNINKKTTEQIYQEIFHKATKINIKSFIWDLLEGKKRSNGTSLGSSEGNSSGKSSKHFDEGLSSKEKAMWKREWQSRVDSVNQTSKGSMPGGLAAEITALENPQLPWYRILRQRWLSKRKTLSWRKINKKFLPFYFPGSSKVKEISAVVAFDTSGSITDLQLQKALTELYSLAKKFRFVNIDVVLCDTEITDVLKMTSQNWRKFKKLKVKGRGGTDFRPVFNWIKNNVKGKMDLLLFFTDGYGDFPEKAPSYDVIWITFPDSIKRWPFGRSIQLN